MSDQARTILIVLAVALGLVVATAGGAVAGGIAGYLIGSGQRQAVLSPVEQRLQLLERLDRTPQAPSRLPNDLPFLRRILGGEGALILEVVPDGPADSSGIRPGNLITAVDGTSVARPHSLPALIHSHDPGDSVVLTVAGPERERRVEVTLGRTEDADGNEVSWLGVRFRPVSMFGHSRIEDSLPADPPPAFLF